MSIAKNILFICYEIVKESYVFDLFVTHKDTYITILPLFRINEIAIFGSKMFLHEFYFLIKSSVRFTCICKLVTCKTPSSSCIMSHSLNKNQKCTFQCNHIDMRTKAFRQKRYLKSINRQNKDIRLSSAFNVYIIFYGCKFHIFL